MVRETRLLMGMPITVAVVDAAGKPEDIAAIFEYFSSIDEKFSPYKETSETAAVNRDLPEAAWSNEMRAVVTLAEKTRKETDGYFSIRTPDGVFNPVGIVKGWAITQAADLLRKRGFHNFFVDAGGDIEAVGKNTDSEPWRVGIRDPFAPDKIVQRLALTDLGIATSGTYIRGDHIFDPHTGRAATELASLTVIGPNACEADRFATAAFAMGSRAIHFLASKKLQGYAIDAHGNTTETDGFYHYLIPEKPIRENKKTIASR